MACALLCALLLLSAGVVDAFAQDLPDLYPEAVPALPQAPDLGPVPDLPPVSGQDPTPADPGDCATASPGAGPLGVDPRGAGPGAPNPLRGLRWFVDPREPAWPRRALMYPRFATSWPGPPRGTRNGHQP